MGQKVNPIGLRLGFNRGWSSHWFSTKEYSKCLQQDDMIKTIIRGKYARASISSIEIFRNRGDIVVNIHTAKPGIIIGRSGAGAQELRSMIEKKLFQGLTIKERPNFRLNIVEVKNPELSATIVAENIANQIERRISVKRAIRQAMERTMEKKAKGIKIKVSGRLGGAEIARSEAASSGSIPLQTLRSDISYALGEAKTTFGVIGVKVWIYLGESDQMPVDQPTSQPPRFK
jgi:small subunit ribosomal protein S3